jgi:hypothetical protein
MAVEIFPHATDDELIEVSTCYMGGPATVKIPKRPIRTDDGIEVATIEEVHLETLCLAGLRGKDKLTPHPAPKAPPTQEQVLFQAPRRQKSTEIDLDFNEIWGAPKTEEFPRQGDRVRVILPDTSGMQDPSKRTVHLRPNRDPTWDQVAYSKFGVPMIIDESIQNVRGGEVIECRPV